MFLDRNGWLQTDDYSIENYTPTGFSRGLVTLTFDDGHEENSTNALPVLQQFGFKSTQCFATSFIEGQPQATLDKVLAFKNAGHEICSHSVTHPQMTTLTDANLDYEAKHSQEYLQSLIGGPVPNFATPYGDYNQRVNDTLKKYYQSHRTVDEGYNSKDNFDKYRLRVQNILDTTTAAQVQAWVQQAQADKTWLILVYHRVANDPGPYDSYINDFTAQMQAIKNSGITVKTYQDALTETLGQL
jgi:peptidoglycan/xylan/chitin deacetylase (PgdA/CDA1 family)